MSTRGRLRKERKEIAQYQTQLLMKERYLQQTAGFRKIMKLIGLIISGAGVLAFTVFLAIWGFQNIPQFKTVSGPFGEIKLTELRANQYATITTDKGDVKVQLDIDKAPKTSANFVLLAQKGFYNDVAFHRIITGFMIQGGDPNSKDTDPANDGQGGPGYSFPDEKISGDYKRGVLAMANSGPNTNGSQFFIMHADSELPKNYVIFGTVVAGMDVVDMIAATPVVDNGQGEVSRPKEAVKIQKVILSDN